jgi:hypothetical protein
MKQPKPLKQSCLYCRKKCDKYKISNNEIRIEEYETIAATCKSYTKSI